MEGVLGYLNGTMDDGSPIRLYARIGEGTTRAKEGYITYEARVDIQSEDGSPVEKMGGNRFKLVLTDQTGTCEGLDRITCDEPGNQFTCASCSIIGSNVKTGTEMPVRPGGIA